jgi:hypothetical protein
VSVLNTKLERIYFDNGVYQIFLVIGLNKKYFQIRKHLFGNLWVRLFGLAETEIENAHYNTNIEVWLYIGEE